MKTTDFQELEEGDEKTPGAAVYVIIYAWDVTKERQRFQQGSIVFRGTVRRHWHREHHVQVITPAARRYRAKWLHLSFRWEDGVSYFDPAHAVMVIPTTEAERADLERRANIEEYEFPEELPLGATARDLSTAGTRNVSGAGAELFAAGEDA